MADHPRSDAFAQGRCRGFVFGAFIALSLLTGFAGSSVNYDPQATFRNIFNDERLRLTAIGIENVGRNAAELTEAQASATADLISRLVARHPSIAYLIGHHEYRKIDLPHSRLFRDDDRSYRFTAKVDPGPAFMARVRSLLRERHGTRKGPNAGSQFWGCSGYPECKTALPVQP